MQFTISTILLALVAATSAISVESPQMAAIRRDVLDLEARGVNGNRPVATGACCVANTSLKEDICTTATGAAGKCVPEGQFANCKNLEESLTEICDTNEG